MLPKEQYKIEKRNIDLATRTWDPAANICRSFCRYAPKNLFSGMTILYLTNISTGCDNRLAGRVSSARTNFDTWTEKTRYRYELIIACLKMLCARGNRQRNFQHKVSESQRTLCPPCRNARMEGMISSQPSAAYLPLIFCLRPMSGISFHPSRPQVWYLRSQDGDFLLSASHF